LDTREVGVADTNVPGLVVLYERDGATLTLHTVPGPPPVEQATTVWTLPSEDRRQ